MTESVLTVIIPTHNRADYLREAIASVLESPLITGPHDIIVVNDSSTDHTPEVIAEAGVRTLTVMNGKTAPTRNAGLELVTTEFVCFLDDDDTWLPGNMEAQLQALREDPEAAFAYGRSQMTTMSLEVIDAEPYPYPPMPRGDAFEQMVLRAPQIDVVLFRTEMIRASGSFDRRIRWNEDGDLLVRLAAKHRAHGVDSVGATFRQRGLSEYDSTIRITARRDQARLYRKWKRLGIKLPLRMRLKNERNLRGLWTYYHLGYARMAAAEGRRTEALKHLAYGLRCSPPHTLAPGSAFWPTAAMIAGRKR